MRQKNQCGNTKTVPLSCCLNLTAISDHATSWKLKVHFEDNGMKRRAHIKELGSGMLIRTTGQIEIKNTTEILEGWCELTKLTLMDNDGFQRDITTCNYQRFLITDNCTGKFYRYIIIHLPSYPHACSYIVCTKN